MGQSKEVNHRYLDKKTFTVEIKIYGLGCRWIVGGVVLFFSGTSLLLKMVACFLMRRILERVNQPLQDTGHEPCSWISSFLVSSSTKTYHTPFS